MSSLKYCVGCGEALDQGEHGSVDNRLKKFYVDKWCVNEECIRFGLTTIASFSEKPKPEDLLPPILPTKEPKK